MLPELRSKRQNLDRIARALTMTGTVSLPQILSGSAYACGTVIDSQRANQGIPEWLNIVFDDASQHKRVDEGAVVSHRGKFWRCIASTDQVPVADSEPEVGAETATHWEEIDLGAPPGRDRGRVAAKIVIQNVGTNPIKVIEGGGFLQIDGGYHMAIAAGVDDDDGKGGAAQWNDVRNACIRISSSAGDWRAAVKIIWDN